MSLEMKGWKGHFTIILSVNRYTYPSHLKFSTGHYNDLKSGGWDEMKNASAKHNHTF